MSIDFTLTPDQQKLQKIARAFSEDVLKPVVKEADLEPDTQKAFQMMKGPYKEAYKLGSAMGFLPKEYGGGGISNVDLQIVARRSRPSIPGLRRFY
jgi:nitroalkane oxidase